MHEQSKKIFSLVMIGIYCLTSFLCLGCLKAIKRDPACSDSRTAGMGDSESDRVLGGYLVGSGIATDTVQTRLPSVFKIFRIDKDNYYLDAFVPITSFLLAEYDQVSAHILPAPNEEIIVPLNHSRLGLITNLKQDIEKAKQEYPKPELQEFFASMQSHLASILLYETVNSPLEELESNLEKLRLRRLRFEFTLNAVNTFEKPQEVDLQEKIAEFIRITKAGDEQSFSNVFGDLYEVTEQLLQLKQRTIAGSITEKLPPASMFGPKPDIENKSRELIAKYATPTSCSKSAIFEVPGADQNFIQNQDCFEFPALKDELNRILDHKYVFSGENGDLLVQTLVVRVRDQKDKKPGVDTWFATLNPESSTRIVSSNISQLLLEKWAEDSEFSIEKAAGPKLVFAILTDKDSLKGIDPNLCPNLAVVSNHHWPVYTREAGCIVLYSDPAQIEKEIPSGETGAPPIGQLEVKERGAELDDKVPDDKDQGRDRVKATGQNSDESDASGKTLENRAPENTAPKSSTARRRAAQTPCVQ